MTLDHVNEHRACLESLPWLVNETLGQRERARIEAHLESCRECQEELAALQRLRAAIRAEDAVVLAPQASLQKLMQRIEESSAPEPIMTPKRASHWPRWAATAASVTALAMTALIAPRLTAPSFETLTSAPGPAASAERAAAIRIVFDDNVRLEEARSLLRSIDAQIVAGPSEAGVYTLALARDERIDAALARLRADPHVVFAEAIAESAR